VFIEESPTTAPIEVRHRSPRVVLAVAALGVFMAFVDATIVNIAFPRIAADFDGTSTASLQWVLNAYNVVFAAFLIASGQIADLLGRRKVFVFALVVFTVASAACAAAPTVGALIAARVVQALGASLLVPASLALVLNAFPESGRNHAVALWTATGALAAGIGPLSGALLMSVSSWRTVFVVNIPIGIVAVVLALRLLPESYSPRRGRRPDFGGALILATAIAALVLTIVEGSAWGWGSAATLGSAGAGLALAGGFVRRCRVRAVPLIDLKLFGDRTFGVANVATVLGAAGFFGYTLINVLFLTEIWHYGVIDAGLAMTPGPLIAATIASPASRLVARFGPRAVIAPGAFVWSAAVVWLITRVGSSPDFIHQWLPGVVMTGIGAGLVFPTLSGTAVSAMPGQDFGTSSGINAVARQIGSALGVALVIARLGDPATPQDALAAFDGAWLVAAGLLGAAACAALMFARGPSVRAA
jgi:NTE family protein